VVSFLETPCTYTDAAYCYQPSSVVCLSVSLSVTSEPCANSLAKNTDRDSVWVEDLGGPKESYVRWEGAILRGERGVPL